MFTRPHKRVTSKMVGASKCQKHLAKMCDINYMVARALRGDSSVFRSGGHFADVTSAPATLQEALNYTIEAKSIYDSLPEEIKSRYMTPEAFVLASQDESQREYFEKAGLCHNVEKPVPVEVVITNPSPVKGEEVVSSSAVLSHT